MNSPKELLEFRRLSGMEITKEHKVLAEAEEALEELELLWQEIGEGLAPTAKSRSSNLNNAGAAAHAASKFVREKHKTVFQHHGGAPIAADVAGRLQADHMDAVWTANQASAAATAAGNHHKAKRFAKVAALHGVAANGLSGGKKMPSKPSENPAHPIAKAAAAKKSEADKAEADKAEADKVAKNKAAWDAEDAYRRFNPY